MKSAFSKQWIKSVQPRKQRKYRYNAPLNVRQKFMRSHISKELSEKHGVKTFGLRKGDTVKIMRGQFKGRTGKVEEVKLSTSKIHIVGIEIAKKEGSKAYASIDPSNVMIIEFNLDDKKRKEKLNAMKGQAKAELPKAEQPKAEQPKAEQPKAEQPKAAAEKNKTK